MDQEEENEVLQRAYQRMFSYEEFLRVIDRVDRQEVKIRELQDRLAMMGEGPKKGIGF
jgi:hypothetical protein